MDRKAIVTKTAKGMREASGATRSLARDLKLVLQAVDGKSTSDDLARRLDQLSEPVFEQTLERLTAEGYVREVPPNSQDADDASDLDFTRTPRGFDARQEAESEARRKAEETARRWAAKREKHRAEERTRRDAEKLARREAEGRAAREAEERARRLDEERAALEAEERAKRIAEKAARKVAAEQARREVEERSRREAEARACREAAEGARREAEESARRQAEEAARRLAEEVALRKAAESARREAEEAARRHVEELARREAQELVRREAEESARREAEEQARIAEEEARLETEERAQREAEERARREAEEQARREAEERARREAEEEARRRAEMQARREAARQARRAARDKVLQAVRDRIGGAIARYIAWRVEDKARRQPSKVRHLPARDAAPMTWRRPVRWRRGLVYSIFAVLAGSLVLLHLVPFDSQMVRFEKVATERFRQPAAIRTVHFSLLRGPHWSLEGVTVGAAGQIRAPHIRLYVDWAALLGGDRPFKSVEADAPRVTEEGLGWLLFGTARGQTFGATRVEVHHAVLDADKLGMPPFDVFAQIGADGNWRVARAVFIDTDLDVTLEPAKDGIAFSARSNLLAPPFLPSMPALTGFSAEGALGQDGVRVTRFEGRAAGGIVSGSAHLRTGERTLEGDVTAKGVDLARLTPGLFEGGLLDGEGSFSLSVGGAGDLAPPRFSGSFVAQRGSLAGIDMGSVLKDTGRGGNTRFARLEGDFAMADGQARLRQFRLDAGALSARGSAEMTTDRSVHGRVDVDFGTATLHRHGVLELSGRFAEPYAKNVGWTRR